jgi:hypothetical protein
LVLVDEGILDMDTERKKSAQIALLANGRIDEILFEK